MPPLGLPRPPRFVRREELIENREVLDPLLIDRSVGGEEVERADLPLRLAHQAVFRDFAASVGEVSPGRAGLLLLIEANPGIAQGRLARAVGLDRTTMVGVIHALQAAGFVERRDGADRRSKSIWLTSQGRRRVAELKRRIARHEERIAARLSAAERRRLIALLAKLAP